MVDKCVVCGTIVPEGTMVCNECNKSIMSNNNSKKKVHKIKRKD